MVKGTNRDEYTFLSIKVESYKVAVGVAVNVNPRTSIPHNYDDDDPVFTPEMRIEIVGTCTYPDNRASERYEITIYSERSESQQPKLKDIRARDKSDLPVYRPYRGQQIPVYDRPPGLAVLRKNRVSRDWTLALWVLPSITSDMVALLSGPRALYGSIHERNVDRVRWVQSFSLQTRDPAG